MIPKEVVTGQFGAWFRKFLFDVEDTIRLARREEKFYILASQRIALTALLVLPNQVVTNGLDDDMVITQILAATPNQFTFNFKIGGSQQYFFSQEVSVFQFFLTVQPYQLVRPIILKAGGSLLVDITEVDNAAYVMQLGFGGYRLPAGSFGGTGVKRAT